MGLRYDLKFSRRQISELPIQGDGGEYLVNTLVYKPDFGEVSVRYTGGHNNYYQIIDDNFVNKKNRRYPVEVDITYKSGEFNFHYEVEHQDFVPKYGTAKGCYGVQESLIGHKDITVDADLLKEMVDVSDAKRRGDSISREYAKAYMYTSYYVFASGKSLKNRQTSRVNHISLDSVNNYVRIAVNDPYQRTTVCRPDPYREKCETKWIKSDKYPDYDNHPTRDPWGACDNESGNSSDCGNLPSDGGYDSSGRYRISHTQSIKFDYERKCFTFTTAKKGDRNGIVNMIATYSVKVLYSHGSGAYKYNLYSYMFETGTTKSFSVLAKDVMTSSISYFTMDRSNVKYINKDFIPIFDFATGGSWSYIPTSLTTNDRCSLSGVKNFDDNGYLGTAFSRNARKRVETCIDTDPDFCGMGG